MHDTCHRRRRAGAAALCVLLVCVLAGCDWSEELGLSGDDEDDADGTPPVAETRVPGLRLVVSERGFDNSYDALVDAISTRTTVNTIAVDHRANAAGVPGGLRPTRVLIHDPVNRTAPLIAADPRAALDLPPAMLVYRDGDDETGIAYNSAAYLAARHDLDDAEDGALEGLADAQQAIAEEAAGATVDDPDSAAGIGEGEGIERRESAAGFAATANALSAAINDDAALVLIDRVDLQARANSTGRALDPAVLFFVSAPEEATSLMRGAQTAGIDLPPRMLVTQADDGTVAIHWNEPAFIAERHGITDRDESVVELADRLDALADTAADAATAQAGGSNLP